MVPTTDTVMQQLALLAQKDAEHDKEIAAIVPVIAKHSDQIGALSTATATLAQGAEYTTGQMQTLMNQVQRQGDRFDDFVTRYNADYTALKDRIAEGNAHLLTMVSKVIADSKSSDASLQKETQQIAGQNQKETTQIYKTLTGASLQFIYFLLGIVAAMGGYVISHLVK